MIINTVIKKEVLLNTGGILFENSPNASKPLYKSSAEISSIKSPYFSPYVGSLCFTSQCHIVLAREYFSFAPSPSILHVETAFLNGGVTPSHGYFFLTKGLSVRPLVSFGSPFSLMQKTYLPASSTDSDKWADAVPESYKSLSAEP